MSRSRRTHPIIGRTTATSEKHDKVLAHRAERTALRAAIASDREPPSERRFGDPWTASKDGKHYVTDAPPELFRK